MRKRLLSQLRLFFVRFQFIVWLASFIITLHLAWLWRQNYIYSPEERVKVIESTEISSSLDALSSKDLETNIKVSITGAVVNPGVYELTGGSVVQLLVDAAGGLGDEADKVYFSQNVNLAQELQAGQQIYVPFLEERKLAKLDTPQATQPGTVGDKQQNLISINTASSTELQKLPGVGESTAEKIIAARPFEKLEDLLEVSGIGDATFAKWEGLISL